MSNKISCVRIYRKQEEKMNTIENLKKYNQTRILKLLENASAQNAKTLLTDLKKLNFDEFFEFS